MGFIIFIYIVIAIISLVFGVIVPALKLHKCTYEVHGRVTNIKDNSFDSSSSSKSGTVTYFYKGKTYRKRRMNLGIHNGNNYTNLLIDPLNPKRCILKNKTPYYAEIIIFSCMTLVCVGVAIYGSICLWISN